MDNNELLPVGSIVNIRFSKGKYMIIGFYTKDANTNEIYDYSAVVYPYGLINLNDVTMFNKDLIKKVVYRGFDSEEDKLFKDKLNDLVKKMNKQ